MKEFKKYISRLSALAILLSLIIGCNDEDTFDPINPTAAFTYEINADNPFEVSFVSTITDRDSLRWNFGDGGTSTLAHPTHVYAEVGSYDLTLTAFGEPGSTPTVIDTIINIEVLDPEVDFTYSASTSNQLEVKFTTTANFAKSYAWDFGDGGTSGVKSPTHIFDEVGTYTVTLTATGFEGSTPTVVTKSVSVGEVMDKLDGTLIGHEGSWDGVNGLIRDAVDGDLSTFVDATDGDGGYVGYDFGEDNKALIKLIRVAPRSGYTGRVVGAEIRASNDADYLNNYDVLYTINEEPSEGALTEATIPLTKSYRYVYYYSAPGGYCNVAEIEFYGEMNPFDPGVIDMSNWTEAVNIAGISVAITPGTINFSGGADDWPGTAIFQEVTVEAGTYKLDGSLIIDEINSNTWCEMFFSTEAPQSGVDYSSDGGSMAENGGLQVQYSTWNGSPQTVGTYDFSSTVDGGMNTAGNYPTDGIYTFTAPATFYIVIKTGAQQAYDFTLNKLAFSKVE
nr:PKD domain-containing protein [uncultured Draconibacterium sp.]